MFAGIAWFGDILNIEVPFVEIGPKFSGSANRRVDLHFPLIASIPCPRCGAMATTAVNIFLRRNPQVDKRFRAAFPGFLER